MTTLTFESSDLLPHILDLDAAGLDELPFGVIELDSEGAVTGYNRWEQKLSGLTNDQVLGKTFFTQVAPCTNNFMVRERFLSAWDTGESLDQQLDYVFSYKMRPTPVRLRMLVQGKRGWIVVRLADASGN